MTLHVNVSGTWKEITDPRVRVSGTWKNITDGWVYDSGSSLWKRIYQRLVSVPIPSGGIVPWLSSGSPPSGWSLYADLNRLIKGWDGTLGGIGVTGGSRTISFTCTADGAHLGSSTCKMIDNGTVSSGLGQGANNTHAAHSHVCTGDASSHPAYIRAQLIQAGSEQALLPANALLFGNALAGLSEYATTGEYLNYFSDSGAATPGHVAEETSEAFTSDSEANHTHGGNGLAYVYLGLPTFDKASAGGHSHSFTISNINWDLQRRIVQAFTDISNDFGCPPGAIIGWPTNTAPSGWNLCDGNNGTIDLRGYFIFCDSNGTYGDSAGDNTVDFSYTTNTAGSHEHQGNARNNYINANRYHSDAVSHNHSGSEDISQEWTYLTLAFIQAAA